MKVYKIRPKPVTITIISSSFRFKERERERKTLLCEIFHERERDNLRSRCCLLRPSSPAIPQTVFSGDLSPLIDQPEDECSRNKKTYQKNKVKPVRDTILHALQLWKSLRGTDASELSEAGSSIKGDHSDIQNTSESTLKTKIQHESVRKRVPFSVRKTGRSYVESPQRPKANDWHIEVNVPKTCNMYSHDEESEGSCVTKTFERTRSDITSTQDIGYEYVPMDDKQEFSSASNIHTSNSFGTNLAPPVIGEGDSQAKSQLVKPNQHQAEEEISTEEQRYFSKSQDRRSLDSTITESSSPTMDGQRPCCMQTTKEMVFIRDKLLEIETKQSNLLDLLQVFATRTMDSLSMIQVKVLALEDVVDRISEDMSHGGRRSAKLLNKSSTTTTASPRLSTCTPRSSVDILRTRQSPLRKSDTWEDSTFSRSKAGQGGVVVDSWMDPMVKVNVGKDMQKSSSGLGGLNRSRHNSSQRYLSQGDLDSAYVEALSSGDELVLVDLLDKTGPVLESLSNRTANDILTTLASFLTQQQFMTRTIPWLQQAVELSSGHGPNQLVLTAKARRQLLSAIQEAVNMEFPNATERRSVAHLVSRLHRAWGKCP